MGEELRKTPVFTASGDINSTDLPHACKEQHQGIENSQPQNSFRRRHAPPFDLLNFSQNKEAHKQNEGKPSSRRRHKMFKTVSSQRPDITLKERTQASSLAEVGCRTGKARRTITHPQRRSEATARRTPVTDRVTVWTTPPQTRQKEGEGFDATHDTQRKTQAHLECAGSVLRARDVTLVKAAFAPEAATHPTTAN